MFTVPAAIDREGIPPIDPPVFDGPVVIPVQTIGVPMVPYEMSQHFDTGDIVASYSIAGEPSWMSINTASGQLTGTPDAIAVTNNVIVTATNSGGSTPTDPFTVTVQDVSAGTPLMIIQAL